MKYLEKYTTEKIYKKYCVSWVKPAEIQDKDEKN